MLEVLDADAVRRWYRSGLAALEATRAEIDSLNVFPVADADTGTNLLMTLEAQREPVAEGDGSRRPTTRPRIRERRSRGDRHHDRSAVACSAPGAARG